MTTPRLADVVAALDALYPPAWADDWDRVGLVVGDPAEPVDAVLFSVDPLSAVVAEAVESGAGLLVTHHPLLLRGVHSVAADTVKGGVVHALAHHGIGLYTAHTNADSAPNGVSACLARLLGLEDVRPLVPAPADPLDKVVVFVPEGHVGQLIDALAAAGAGSIGDYDRCAFVGSGEGTFRPGRGAHPAIGRPGAIEVVAERRVEMVVERSRRSAVVAALRRAHPYEEPAFDIVELAPWPGERGTGAVGALPDPMSLAEFAAYVAGRLPRTPTGVRVAGDPGQTVRTVALVGGAGDAYFDQASASGADVYLTSDLRHHPASEFRERTGAPALLDVSHWAAEWPWLAQADSDLQAELGRRGFEVRTAVSTLCTDPWDDHVNADEGSTS